MSRQKISRRCRKLRREAAAFGAELLTNEKTFIDDEHLDCVWYGGYIGGLRYKGYEVSIEVCGDVDIYGFVNGADFQYRNRSNTGAMNMTASDSLRTAFKSDYELQEALNAGADAHDKIESRGNNWIEAYVRNPDGTWNGDGTVLDYDNVLDACGHISEWIDWLEKEFIKDTRASSASRSRP